MDSKLAAAEARLRDEFALRGAGEAPGVGGSSP